MSRFIPQGMGWIPDLPDARDYTARHAEIVSLLDGLKRMPGKELPDEVDLRTADDEEYFTPPEDQGRLNSSSAFAVLSLVEYFERRTLGRTYEGSKLFLHKVTRNIRQSRVLLQIKSSDSRGELNNRYTHSLGDNGADLRTTIKTLASIGVPNEKHWPYDVDRFDEEPSAFAYAVARPPADFLYFRLDEPGGNGSVTWKSVISCLAAGFPIAFGFVVPTSLTDAADVPYRGELDGIRGGQAAVAVGYHNHHFGRGQHALLVRNSWGTQWGDHGNGWLPYVFLHRQLARDFWTIISERWLETGELARPTTLGAMDKLLDASSPDRPEAMAH